jgi:hypothetical protein
MAQSFRDRIHEHEPYHDLPRQRRGTTPQMHGRYPDHDVLANARHWDDVTRDVVLDRVANVPPISFFTEAEARVLGAFLDVLLAQDAEPRIPVLNLVDAKLTAGRLDGYRHAGMPDDREVWRIVARRLEGEGFLDATAVEREALVGRFADGDYDWPEVDVSLAWGVVTRGALSEFYSHPWAWNEIGFGGPAYPRGYMRLQPGPAGREPHEGIEAFDHDPVGDDRG